MVFSRSKNPSSFPITYPNFVAPINRDECFGFLATVEREDQLSDKATIRPRGMLTSAVTEKRKVITHRKQASWMASFGTVRNDREPLSNPYQIHDLCPVNLYPPVENRVAQIPARVEEMSTPRFHIRTAPQTLTEYRDVQLERLRSVEPEQAGPLDPIAPTCRAGLLPQ
jgi:hypothetical protein